MPGATSRCGRVVGALHAEVFSDQQLLDAAWVTLKVGLVSASVATVLGTMLWRWRWRGSGGFGGCYSA